MAKDKEVDDLHTPSDQGPEFVDVEEGDGAAPADGAEKAAEGDGAGKPAHPLGRDAVMEGIYARRRAEQEADGGVKFDEPSEAEEGQEPDGTDKQPAVAEPATVAKDAAAAATGADQITVDLPMPDGTVRRVNQADLITLARQGLAANDTLSEARRTLDEIKGERRNPAGEPAAPDGEKQPATDNTILDGVDVDGFVKAVQFGEGEDARKAAKSFAESIANSVIAKTRMDAGAIVRDATYSSWAQRQIEEGLESFRESFQDVVGDQHLASLAAQYVNVFRAEDLHRLGYKPEDVARMTPEALTRVHLMENYRGRSQATAADVFSRAGQATLDWLATKSPAGKKPGKPAEAGGAKPNERRIRAKRDAPSTIKPAMSPRGTDAEPTPKTTDEVISEGRMRGFAQLVEGRAGRKLVARQ